MEGKINPDQPAFPNLHSIDGNWIKEPIEQYAGMPIRLELAARFMAALLANGGTIVPDKAADLALLYADILIKEYNQ